jgi:hypothetical protein
MDFENVHARVQTSELGTWSVDGSGLFDGRELQAQSMLLSGPNDCLVRVGGRWDVGNLDHGRANLVVTNFSALTIPLLQPHLGGLPALSGTISVTRSGDSWSFDHDISTDQGSMKGAMRIEKIPDGRHEVTLDSQFANLKVHLSRNLPDASLNGRIGIKAVLEGANLLDAQFTAHLGPSLVGTEKVQSCELNGTFADSVLKVTSDALKCSLADLKFALTADLHGLSDARHQGGVKAEVSLDRGNLEKINSRLQQKLAGQISIEANYDPGNFTNLRLWQA